MVVFRDRIATCSDGAIRSLKTCSQCRKMPCYQWSTSSTPRLPKGKFAFIKDCMNGHLTVEGRRTFPSDSLARKSSGVMRVFGETPIYGDVFAAGFRRCKTAAVQ